MCISSPSNPNNQKCFIPNHIRSVWIISFALAIGAVGFVASQSLFLHYKKIDIFLFA
jgi:hypothetical protein